MNELVIVEPGADDDAVEIVTDVNAHAEVAIDLGCGDDNPYN